MMGVSRPARSTASHHQRSRPRSVPRPQTSPSDEEQLRNPNRRFLQPLHRLTGPRSPVLLHSRQRGKEEKRAAPMTGTRFLLCRRRPQTAYANLSPSSHQSGGVLRGCRYREPTRVAAERGTPPSIPDLAGSVSSSRFR
ncbi:hypothetical protein Bca4012_031210 [Brassica carinata]|uniref:Uncharacterized protein n=1 Tax=Brassica carinata TaxID=52824 RepID=A0A8X7RJ73_BRACI|nr:hypothetical protein Bca52824_047547 [Brassica carinata]